MFAESRKAHYSLASSPLARAIDSSHPRPHGPRLWRCTFLPAIFLWQ